MGTSAPDRPGPVGVFGGTFDPVHFGHLRVALDALELLGLAQVRMVPLARAVHRDQPETPAELRLAMLEAALAGREDLVADAVELERSGPSYTVDTLATLKLRLPGRTLCLMIGDDAFNGFADWRDPRGILDLANLVVLQRPAQAPASDQRLIALLQRHRVDRLDPQRRAGQIVSIAVTQLDIASSAIRDRLRAGRSADFLVPDPVLELIRRHSLYR
jgi:nicotinate-nucleotide adenylyltransferase